MSYKIVYTPYEQVSTLRDVCALVLSNWDYLASSRVGYIYLQSENLCDDVRIPLGSGICYWVEVYLDCGDMVSVYESWEHFSGSTVYPVGGEVEYYNRDESNKYRNPDRKALVEWVRDCCDEALGCMENSDE